MMYVRVVWHVGLVFICTLIEFRTVFAGTVDLSGVRKLMLGKFRQYQGMTVRSVCVNTSSNSNNSIWLQLWKEDPLRKNMYILEHQVKLVPKYHDGKNETFIFSADEVFAIDARHRLGFVNAELPGPVHGHHNSDQSAGGGIYLSRDIVINDTDLEEKITINSSWEFVDFFLPYELPFVLCPDTGCKKEKACQRPPPRPPLPVASSTESFLLTERMIIGLIIWNIVLSLIIFILLLAITCICADLERRRKERLRGRHNVASNIETDDPFGNDFKFDGSWNSEGRDSGKEGLRTIEEHDLN